MRNFYFLVAGIFLLNSTNSWGKAVLYNGGSTFFLQSPDYAFPITSDMWSPPDNSSCGTTYTDRLYYVKTEYDNICLANLNDKIGASTYFSWSRATASILTEKWAKATISGGSCPIGEVHIPGDTYSTTSIAVRYYGFRTVISGLTYYGWFKMENGHALAYIEDIPGFSIQAGDMVGMQTYPSTFIKLQGTVYRDNDKNGSYNTGDSPLPYHAITLGIYSASTGTDGTYTMMVPGNLLTGSKSLSLNLSNREIYNTPSNGTRSISFPAFSDITNLNFGVNYDLSTESLPQVSVHVSPGLHRRCFKSTTSVIIQNNSSTVLANIPLSIEIPAYVEVLNSTPAYQTLQSKVANYIVPTLAAHGTYTITLTDSIICGNESIRGQSQCYRAIINTPFEGSDIFPYYECQDSVGMFKLVNKGTGEMSDSSTYEIYANNVLQAVYKYKTNAVDTFYIAVPNDGRSILVKVNQESSNTRTNMRYAIAEGCGNAVILSQNIGLADQITTGDETYYSNTSCFIIRDSYDPNELIASPTGWGIEHKILKEEEISYHIGFQNTGSAPAVSIVLIDTLSTALDLSTFKILYSTHAFKSEITPTPDGRLRLAVTYSNINLPASSANEPGSHGYFEFAMHPKSTTVVGTQISNKAYIYFDYNSYITTNTVLQTIALPETVSNPLSARTSGGQFEVENQMLTYGDAPADPALTTNAGSVGLVASSLNTDIVTFESGKLVIHKSGTATLNYKHNGNDRYLPIVGEKQRTVTVEKAPLTIEAVSKKRFVGEQNPVWEWNATGFVYNEDQSVLQGNPEISCTADETSAMADYAITISAGTLSADNYNITYVPGTLKVVQTDGIQDWSASGIRVYPIPSKGGNFTVDVPYEKLNQVTLTDMKGRTEVYDQSRISSQLQGIVLIKIYTDKNVYSGKIELTQ